MKSYEEKRQVLCDLAELYLENDAKSYIDVNDGIMDSADLNSISFLILMALTYPEEYANNYYAMGLNIDSETQKNFVDGEYKKVMASRHDLAKKGKMVLDDAKSYYNRKYGNISYEQINEIARKLGEMGFHI